MGASFMKKNCGDVHPCQRHRVTSFVLFLFQEDELFYQWYKSQVGKADNEIQTKGKGGLPNCNDCEMVSKM